MKGALVVPLALALVASLAINLWLWQRGHPQAAPQTPVPACPDVPSEQTAASIVALFEATAAQRRAELARAKEDAPKGTAEAVKRSSPVLEGRVDRALLDAEQCRVAREKAASAWRDEADALRRMLMSAEAPDAQARASTVAVKRDALADVLGVEEDDARVASLAEQITRLTEETEAQLKLEVAKEPPDWRAALDLVRGLYRQEDAAVRGAFSPEAAEDWRLHEIETRAAILAIGASLVGVAWDSVDDRTPAPLP